MFDSEFTKSLIIRDFDDVLKNPFRYVHLLHTYQKIALPQIPQLPPFTQLPHIPQLPNLPHLPKSPNDWKIEMCLDYLKVQ